MSRHRGQPHKARPRSKGLFHDLLAHYSDLVKRRRWRLLAGELAALTWSALVLGIASLPKKLTNRIRHWLRQEQAKPCHSFNPTWQRHTNVTIAALAVFALVSMRMPAVPGSAHVDNPTDYDANIELESLVSLIAEDDPPMFATASKFSSFTIEEVPRASNQPRGWISADGLLAPEVTTQLPNVVPPEGLTHVVQQGESLWDICRDYRVKMADVVSWNGLTNPNRLAVGTRLFLPGAQSVPDQIRMISPLAGRLRVTSNYGYRIHPILKRRKFHKGVDLRASRGAPIRVVADGQVVEARRAPYLGYYVRVQHDSTTATVYGHCSKLLVKKGDTVKAGETIAKVGSTGMSTGPHLHFEIWKDRRHTNPLAYLQRVKDSAGG